MEPTTVQDAHTRRRIVRTQAKGARVIIVHGRTPAEILVDETDGPADIDRMLVDEMVDGRQDVFAHAPLVEPCARCGCAHGDAA